MSILDRHGILATPNLELASVNAFLLHDVKNVTNQNHFSNGAGIIRRAHEHAHRGFPHPVVGRLLAIEIAPPRDSPLRMGTNEHSSVQLAK